MSQGITISGLDDCLRYFDNAPEELVKAEAFLASQQKGMEQ